MAAKDEMPLWSPWFEIIAHKFLKTWWEDLDGVAGGRRCADYGSIHRFDCPAFVGGQGGATPYLDALEAAVQAAPAAGPVLKQAFRTEMLGDVASTTAVYGQSGAELKQGAYGKVPTHKHSKLDQLLRPAEVRAALTLKFFPALAGLKDNLGGDGDADVQSCFAARESSPDASRRTSEVSTANSSPTRRGGAAVSTRMLLRTRRGGRPRSLRE